jgi:Rhomboid family
VFLFQDSLSPDELELFLRQFALIPARYSEAFASGESDLAAVDFVPFFTMMFLHGGWLHLILNMWTLWLFGPAIEDRLGHLPSGILSRVWPRGFGCACHVQPDFDRTRTGRLRRNCRHSRKLYAAVSAGAFRRGGPDPVHPAVLRSLRVRLYRPVVPASSSAIDDRPPAAGCQRRRRVAGPCRRLHSGIRAWPAAGPIRTALPTLLPGRRRARL